MNENIPDPEHARQLVDNLLKEEAKAARDKKAARELERKLRPYGKHPKLAALWVDLCGLFAHAWWLMLITGGLHSAYRGIPNFGYWWSLAIVWLVGVLIGKEFDVHDVKWNRKP